MSENVPTILLVDDDEIDRKAIRRAIKKANIHHNIVETSNVDEAIDICRSQEIHFILFDYKMPKQDGLDGVAKLRKIYPYKPIIMITGQGDEFIAVKALELGAQEYIPKDHINEDSIQRLLKNAAEKIELKRKIDEQHRNLENFSRILAHDLKMPTHIICSFLKLILKAIKDKKYEDIPEYYDHIQRSANYMNDLIDTLREYTKLDGKVEFEIVPIKTIIHEALHNLSSIVKERRVQIIYDDKILPRVYGNKTLLTQLFQNLLSNAIKYCKEDVPMVHVDVKKEDNHWLFFVKDNGIGISKIYLKSIFDPFKRLHSRDDYPGTGLGLATCKKILERHKGKIWCQSKEGQSTTFFFTIPFKEDS